MTWYADNSTFIGSQSVLLQAYKNDDIIITWKSDVEKMIFSEAEITMVGHAF
jgi:hypothetical protein